MTKNILNETNKASLITHHDNSSDFNIQEHEKRLKARPNGSLVFTLEEEIDLLRELAKFELGRFMLKNQGLNGYWTSYIILNDLNDKKLTPLEKWLLTESPIIKATKERYYIFKDFLESNLRDNVSIASIPCGIMDDLLRLDTKKFKNIKFTGIDLDEESLLMAEDKAKDNPNVECQFFKKDAWNLGLNNQFDIIASNGLNIYQPDNEQVLNLYKNFYAALKEGGKLLTSFLTPPPLATNDSSWKNYDPKNLLKQKAILGSVIGVKWQQIYRTHEQTLDQLKKAGFSDAHIVNDDMRMFPTVIAIK